MKLTHPPHLEHPDSARKFLEEIRWPAGPACPHCNSPDKPYRLEGSATRTGLFKCSACRMQFTVTVGTLLEGSKVPLHLWLQAVYLMSSTTRQPNLSALQKSLGVSHRTASLVRRSVLAACRAVQSEAGSRESPEAAATSVTDIVRALLQLDRKAVEARGSDPSLKPAEPHVAPAQLADARTLTILAESSSESPPQALQTKIKASFSQDLAGRNVQSIEIGARLLRALTEAGVPLMLRDLAARADIKPGQAHPYLLSFRRVGLVEQNPDTGRYLLGPFALHMGLARARSVAPLHQAQRAAMQLSTETGMMTTTSVWGSHGPTVLHIHDGTVDLNINLRPGKVTGLLDVPLGHVFASYLPWALVESRLHTELSSSPLQGVRSIEDCHRLIGKVRSDGYSAMHAAIPSINSAAAPIFDMSGKVQVVLTLVGPEADLDITPGSGQIAALLEASFRTSAELGYRVW